jgi:quinol monooxygenase YgiN
MAKVIFSIEYEVLPNKRDEYFGIMREMKALVAGDGLISYNLYEKKNKANNFEEIYVFESNESYEQFDDNQNERIDILMSKLSDLIKENTTKYNTLNEVF